MTGRRGFFGIGVYHPKHEVNVGTLWRSAYLMGAAFVFTIGRRYVKQSTDTVKTTMHIPLIHYGDVDAMVRHLPHSCPLVGVELDPRAKPLSDYNHLDRAAYLLGAEDHGLPLKVVDRCHGLVRIESVRDQSMNVSMAGSILMWHRHIQRTGQKVRNP